MRRAKRAVLILATLAILALAGCKSSPYASTDSTSADSTASLTPQRAPMSAMVDGMSGRWKVTYELTSVKPSSMRREASKNALKTWQCVISDGQMTLFSSTSPYRGTITQVGPAKDKRWNYKAQADFVSAGGEAWTSDIDTDGRMLSPNAFTAKQTMTLTSSSKGKYYTATWSIKGDRTP